MLIKDDGLRQVIASKLKCKEDEINENNMMDLIYLDAQEREIECLDGLEYAQNIETLILSRNKLQSLDPIKDLRNIEKLDVSGNQLRDLQALHGFRQLKSLNISHNNLYTMDISAVAAMINLEYLNMKKAKIDSLVYLEKCAHLKEVSINTENGPFSFAVLGRLKNLKKLDLSGMRLFNIDDLTYISTLEELDLSTNLMNDISALLSMENLRVLNVQNCPYLKDYSLLKEFPSLEELDMSYNVPDNFDFLRSLNKLQVLRMEQSGFSDMRELNHLSSLRKLDVSKNEITHVDDFITVGNLTTFKAQYCQLVSIEFLKKANQLIHLNINNNSIRDISPLKHANHMVDLKAGNNNIEDISALEDMKQLQILNFEYNNVSDISPLKDLKELCYVDFYNNNIEDLSPLKDLEFISYLRLDHN